MVVPLPGDPVTAPTAFVFGKLPAHGDFVARGLSQAERIWWDTWLSDLLRLARDAWGDELPAIHEAAPTWCFVRRSPEFAGEWSVGAVAPSIDAAGRRFFLVVGGEKLSRSEACGGATLAEVLEDLIRDAFRSFWDADTLLSAAINALSRAPDLGSNIEPSERWWTSSGGSVGCLHPARPADLLSPRGLGLGAEEELTGASA